ncbi:MAG: ABC transporter substrate-binding protein [Deltaproteobacteria bacterium]|nr:ABC transporter substrate-binding protein [Deltaproteobacteria bacterium]
MIGDMRSPYTQLTMLARISIKKSRFILFFLFISVSMTPAHGKDTIDIAAIYALTGVAADTNALTLQGVGYAVDEINKQGGVLSKKINLLVFDNQSTPIGSTVAAQRAAEAGVVGIVGSDWSSHSIAVARVAQNKGIPMISSLATNPEVTKIGDYIYRVCFTDDFQGQITAKFARQDLNAATATIFVDVTSDYSLKLSQIFRIHFERLGGHVVLELEYKQKQQQFDEEVKKAVKADADVIFIPGHDESGLIAKQAQDAGSASILLGGDGWSSPAFLRKGGRELKHGYYSTHWSVYLETDRSRSFVDKYAQSEVFDENIALGYDAMMLMADAIARSGSVDRKKIKDAIANTRSFEGVTGTINFNDSGDPIKGAVFMEIKNGKPCYLKTQEP